MKFKIDENLPLMLTERLTSAGIDAVSVRDQGLSEKDDRKIIEVSRIEKRVLVTLDVRLADLRSGEIRNSPGIVLLRLSREGRLASVNAVMKAMHRLENMKLDGRVVVVTETRIRVH